MTERTVTNFHFLRKLQISHSPLAPSSQVFLGLFKDFLKSLAYYTYFAADRVEKTFNSTSEETFKNKAKRFPSNTEIALVPYTRMMQRVFIVYVAFNVETDGSASTKQVGSPTLPQYGYGQSE